jgi:hypothetical protein
MSANEDCRNGNCPYQVPATDEEIEAMAWVLRTLHRICDRGKPNADKATLAIRLLHKTGDHMRMLVERAHELEDVLHAAGLCELDASKIERLVPGELN